MLFERNYKLYKDVNLPFYYRKAAKTTKNPMFKYLCEFRQPVVIVVLGILLNKHLIRFRGSSDLVSVHIDMFSYGREAMNTFRMCYLSMLVDSLLMISPI